tara:strand:+ start:4156 stop:5028 length:873 start_codon:yes stop_codon:yes gene_type:complete
MKYKNNLEILILGGGFIAGELGIFLKKNFSTKVFARKEIDFSKTNSILKFKKYCNINSLIFISAARAPVKNKKMFDYNIRIMKNILKCIRVTNYKKIIYLSSDAVYSDTLKKINEASKTNPSSLHGKMHLDREIMLQKVIKDNNKLLILRPTLVYGPSDPHNGYGPNKFIRAAKFLNEISLFGKGEEKRDHIYIGDLVKLISQLLELDASGIFNICTGKVVSFKKIMVSVQKAINKNIYINYIPRIGPLPHLGYRSFNINKIRKTLNKFNFVNLEKKFIKKISAKYRKFE